jgi:hypothetical protein
MKHGGTTPTETQHTAISSVRRQLTRAALLPYEARSTEPAVTTVVDGVVLVAATGVTVVNWFEAVVTLPMAMPAAETAQVAPVAAALTVL